MNTFTLPRECVLPVLLAAPQQEALPECALAMPGLVGSTKLMSHCRAWVSVKIGHLISSGCIREPNSTVPAMHVSHILYVHKILQFVFTALIQHFLFESRSTMPPV